MSIAEHTIQRVQRVYLPQASFYSGLNKTVPLSTSQYASALKLLQDKRGYQTATTLREQTLCFLTAGQIRGSETNSDHISTESQ